MFKIPYTPTIIKIGNIVYIRDYGGESGQGEDFDDWVRESHERISKLNLTPEQLRKWIEDSENPGNSAQNEEL